MKKLLPAFFALFYGFVSIAQEDLPRSFAPGEKEKMPGYLQSRRVAAENYKGILTPPPFSTLRTMAEWEEIETLFITWTSYTAILREIVKYAQTETMVTISCSDSLTVKNYLTSGGVPLTNLRFIIAPYNSIWCRDYGGNTVYGNEVDSLLMVDWIYNRPRPKDDTIPYSQAKLWNVPMYETAQSPYDLVHTGGNFMADGFGTAFSSQLTDQENTNHSAAQIDTIMKKFMGISRYIRFPVLPYDGIHHIDMHMKLLDEETLLVGQYPQGVSDGPQIEANLAYILANFNSVYGTPYKVVRIPQPPDKFGAYPNAGGYYCTYANATFVNKTVILPTYYTQYDTTALRIWKEALPGYKIIGIDCDNSGSNIISQSGAIHCITHSLGVKDPLLISHQAISAACDTTSGIAVNAKIMHKTGVQSAQVYWTNDTAQGYTAVPMTLTNVQANTWTGYIPQQAAGNKVFYYIKATANNAKTINRPMPAPKSYWKFSVSGCATGSMAGVSASPFEVKPLFPNPASSITCIPVVNNKAQQVKVTLKNVLGQQTDVLHDGMVPAGEKNFFLFADRYAEGVYIVEISAGGNVYQQKVVVK
jgi:agmatine deiminase